MGKEVGSIETANRPQEQLFELARSESRRTGQRRSVHFTSDSVEWATPIEFFRLLDSEFSFELDVCATEENAKCAKYYTKAEDGLSQSWEGVCWCNPPYGREIARWVEKAMETAMLGQGTVVCLLPARTDTKWWHDIVSKSSEVRFVKGRLWFGGHANSAPFPSAVVIFRTMDPESGQEESAGSQPEKGRTIRLDSLMQPELIEGSPATERLLFTALSTENS